MGRVRGSLAIQDVVGLRLVGSGLLGLKGKLDLGTDGVPLVAHELGVDTAHGAGTEGNGLLDTVTVSLLVLVVGGVVLGLGHVDDFERGGVKEGRANKDTRKVPSTHTYMR